MSCPKKRTIVCARAQYSLEEIDLVVHSQDHGYGLDGPVLGERGWHGGREAVISGQLPCRSRNRFLESAREGTRVGAGGGSSRRTCIRAVGCLALTSALLSRPLREGAGINGPEDELLRVPIPRALNAIFQASPARGSPKITRIIGARQKASDHLIVSWG